MKVGIMQPYLFPYIGYFQLMRAVDTFVIYDDVNFIKQGWINRNRLLLNGKDFMFNITLNGASSFKKINEIGVQGNNQKLIKTIEQAYYKAPHFRTVFPMLNEILLYQESNLAKYLTNSLHVIVNYLGIDITILISSEIKKDDSLKADDKIINICQHLTATNYINAIGGQELYSKQKFAQHGLVLNFIKSKPITYQQFKNNFIPWLSIIDVMMFNSKNEIWSLINNYELV
ncbi:MAG: WbqC family protein [Bacteroidota bacterium]|nr:WbqC family protein [Bacteroidota bacterium]